MKLSNIKIGQILFKAKNDDLNKIIFDKEKSNTYKKTDIGIVLSNKLDIINMSLNLYKQEYINKILVFGNNNIEDYLYNNDIPRRDIILENGVNNLFLKINYAIILLSQYYDLDEITLTLLTNDYNLKRSIGIINKLLDTTTTQGIGIKTDELSKLQMYKEAIQICKLAKNGYIEDDDIKQLTFAKQ